MAEIMRRYVRIATRYVHYRTAGSGPALLLVHQSPRSSGEYAALIAAWSRHFTVIAPDTPGFGQSDPLPGDPEIDDFADGLLAFLDALGIDRVGAYGFHSGTIILMTALRKAPHRFTALSAGGYAIWTPEERALFGDAYLPPFQPSAYGEHLTWLWNRILEQSWFFPWFDLRPEARLAVAHDDPVRVDAVVRDMLASGDAYRAGYGAVLRAQRDIPAPDAAVPPVFISAYDGDPLQAHIDRLGPMPKGWRAEKVGSPAEHQAKSLTFLLQHPAEAPPPFPMCETRGFAPVQTDNFAGLVHWTRPRGEVTATIAGPGRSSALLEGACIDPPGHGLSDPWTGSAPESWSAWQHVIDATADAAGFGATTFEAMPDGEADRLFPDLAPDRFGAYLTRAWGIVRAQALFTPWYQASAATARAFDPAQLAPETLARHHLALLQSTAARAYLTAYRGKGGETYGHSRGHAALGAA